MRAKLKVCLEARYLVLSRGFRRADGEVVDPFDEMKTTWVAVETMVGMRLFGLDDVGALVSAARLVDGRFAVPACASAVFASAVRRGFDAISPSTSQELAILGTVLSSVEQLAVEFGMSQGVVASHADRAVFERHKRGRHPRYDALAVRTALIYQREFFASNGDRAMDYVNDLVSAWKKTFRWYRGSGAQRAS